MDSSHVGLILMEKLWNRSKFFWSKLKMWKSIVVWGLFCSKSVKLWRFESKTHWYSDCWKSGQNYGFIGKTFRSSECSCSVMLKICRCTPLAAKVSETIGLIFRSSRFLLIIENKPFESRWLRIVDDSVKFPFFSIFFHFRRFSLNFHCYRVPRTIVPRSFHIFQHEDEFRVLWNFHSW